MISMRFHYKMAAMSLAGMINLSMLVVAAGIFHAHGHTGVDSIEGAHGGLESIVGGVVTRRASSPCACARVAVRS